METIKRLSFGFDDDGNLWLGISDSEEFPTDYRIQILDPDDVKKLRNYLENGEL